jgi:hypothetical protein
MNAFLASKRAGASTRSFFGVAAGRRTLRSGLELSGPRTVEDML